MNITLKIVGSAAGGEFEKFHNQVWNAQISGVGGIEHGLHDLKVGDKEWEFEIQVTKVIGDRLNLFGFLKDDDNMERICFEVVSINEDSE